MFKVELINGDTREIIHYPKENAPCVLSCEINEEINTVGELTASLPSVNSYNINLFKTLIVVTKIDTNEVYFKGRIINSVEAMSDSGEFTREITAESMLGVLNDTYIRTYIKDAKPKAVLTYFLNQASSSTGYVFKAGNVEDYDEVISFEINYETVLSAVLNLAEIIGRQIQTREVGTTIYIDLVKNIGSNTAKTVQMGVNMLNVTKELDTTDFSNRIIPIANDGEKLITIKSVNDNKDYIQDDSLVKQYGVIERVVEDTGTIKDAKTLLKWGKQQLNQYKNIKLILECSAIDLSYLSGTDLTDIKLGDAIHLINNPLGINVVIRVIAKSYNIFTAYNPQLSLSSRKFSATDSIIDLRNRQRIKNKASILNQQSISIEDNITSSKPITEQISISGSYLDANVYVNTDRYRYYTSDGVSYTTYPQNLKLYINNTLVKTYSEEEVIEDVINISEHIKSGLNTIKFTSSNNGRVKAKVEITTRV